ncbi:MAG: hypothetical protein U5M50_06740 [Sphingobium sp.]|nr:hypothetical protein [Sphingobium sp.]
MAVLTPNLQKDSPREQLLGRVFSSKARCFPNSALAGAVTANKAQGAIFPAPFRIVPEHIMRNPVTKMSPNAGNIVRHATQNGGNFDR